MHVPIFITNHKQACLSCSETSSRQQWSDFHLLRFAELDIKARTSATGAQLDSLHFAKAGIISTKQC